MRAAAATSTWRRVAGKAEAQDIGLAEIANDAARDQRLHHRIGLGVAERDLRAAAVRIGGRQALERWPSATRVDRKISKSLSALAFSAARSTPAKASSALSSAESARMGGVPTRMASSTSRAVVGIGEGEGRGMTKPAFEGLRIGRKMPGRDIDEGRSARPTIEIFVAAADGEIGIGGGQTDRQCAGGMRQIPDGERACGVRGSGEPGHVVAGAGAVVDFGEEQHRDIGGEGGRER